MVWSSAGLELSGSGAQPEIRLSCSGGLVQTVWSSAGLELSGSGGAEAGAGPADAGPARGGSSSGPFEGRRLAARLSRLRRKAAKAAKGGGQRLRGRSWGWGGGSRWGGGPDSGRTSSQSARGG